jgi:hypothetical protein
MTWSHPNKQTNKPLSSYIVSHILKLWISMDCCLDFISSFSPILCWNFKLSNHLYPTPHLPIWASIRVYLVQHIELTIPPSPPINMNKSTIQHIELTIPPFPPPINMNKLPIQHVELTILTHKHEQVDSTKQDTITMTPLKIVGQSKTIISLYGPTWRALHCGLILQDSKWVSHSWTRVLHPKHNNIQALWLMWVEILHTSLESMASSKRKYGFLVPLVCMYVCTKDTNQNLTTRSSMHPGKQDYNGQALKEWCLLSFFCEIFYHICMPTRS